MSFDDYVNMDFILLYIRVHKDTNWFAKNIIRYRKTPVTLFALKLTFLIRAGTIWFSRP